MIAIPVSFKLANRTWTVELVAEIDGSKEDTLGCCELHTATVSILNSLTKEQMEDVFFHEFIHAMKGTLGWVDDEENHGECDALGSLIHQMLQTKKGKLV